MGTGNMSFRITSLKEIWKYFKLRNFSLNSKRSAASCYYSISQTSARKMKSERRVEFLTECVFFHQNCADPRATGKSFACEHSHIVCHIRSKASSPLGLVISGVYSAPKQYKWSSMWKSSGRKVISNKQINGYLLKIFFLITLVATLFL